MAKPSKNRGASKPRRYYQELRQSPFSYRSAPDASTVEIDVELNENGPNEANLDALIDNLKYRLNLVMRLKNKLAEFNEDVIFQESI